MSKYPYEVHLPYIENSTKRLYNVELLFLLFCKAPEIGGHANWSWLRHNMETFPALLARDLV